jgi:hypothetical protein
MGEKSNTYKILCGNPSENIKMGVNKTGFVTVKWTEVAWFQQ